MSDAERIAEARRLATICNACRYCEGLCAVFPALELKRTHSDADLRYFANLCHNCGACHAACQFAPPHDFAVNIPKTLAELRVDSYAAYAWPAPTGLLFRRNGLFLILITLACVALFVGGFWALADRALLFQAGAEPGAFFRVLPHEAMIVLFGGAFLFALIALAASIRRCWRDGGAPVDWRAVPAAVGDALTLRYLGQEDRDCRVDDRAPSDRRRSYHHLVFYGFLACFVATAVATLYHFLLARAAPYPWWDLPVLLGAGGGVAICIGTAGLMLARVQRDPEVSVPRDVGFDFGFSALLFLVSASGLALLVARASAAMGLLLAVHLGLVLALFLTLPYGKFVHGLYRFLALVRYAAERRLHG